jgi:hypothetical protein
MPAPGPTDVPADAAALAVIRGWSDALRHGDVRAAARYFALPSTMINGPDSNGRYSVLVIRTPADARAANAGLDCGAEFLSADVRGPYVNAAFLLTERPGSLGGCGAGVNQTGRLNFVIANGKIVEWMRAPDDPEDHAPPPSPGSTV